MGEPPLGEVQGFLVESASVGEKLGISHLSFDLYMSLVVTRDLVSSRRFALLGSEDYLTGNIPSCRYGKKLRDEVNSSSHLIRPAF